MFYEVICFIFAVILLISIQILIVPVVKEEIINIQVISRECVKKISFFCRTGEVVALIGPNGVEKSTILRIIAGIQKADAGKVMLNGVDTSIFNIRKKIGYMTEKSKYYYCIYGKTRIDYFR